jgi:hypothetical protein
MEMLHGLDVPPMPAMLILVEAEADGELEAIINS